MRFNARNGNHFELLNNSMNSNESRWLRIFSNWLFVTTNPMQCKNIKILKRTDYSFNLTHFWYVFAAFLPADAIALYIFFSSLHSHVKSNFPILLRWTDLSRAHTPFTLWTISCKFFIRFLHLAIYASVVTSHKTNWFSKNKFKFSKSEQEQKAWKSKSESVRLPRVLLLLLLLLLLHHVHVHHHYHSSG